MRTGSDCTSFELYFKPRGVFRNQSNICGGALRENSKQLQAVNSFCKKAPFEIFDWVLNTMLKLLKANLQFHILISIQLTFTCSKSTMETLDKGRRY